MRLRNKYNTFTYMWVWLGLVGLVAPDFRARRRALLFWILQQEQPEEPLHDGNVRILNPFQSIHSISNDGHVRILTHY